MKSYSCKFQQICIILIHFGPPDKKKFPLCPLKLLPIYTEHSGISEPGIHNHFLGFSCLVDIPFCIISEEKEKKRNKPVTYFFTLHFKRPSSFIMDWEGNICFNNYITVRQIIVATKCMCKAQIQGRQIYLARLLLTPYKFTTH